MNCLHSWVDSYVDSVKVVGVHDGALEKLDLSEMAFEQTFQLQVRLFPTTHGTYGLIQTPAIDSTQ